MNNWNLFNVLQLYQNNKLLETYSIYFMTAIYTNGKFYALIRFSKGDIGKNTDDPMYGVYNAYSDDGYTFYMDESPLLNFEYWPAAGKINIDGKPYTFAYKNRGEAKLLKLEKNKFVDVEREFKILL